MSKLQRAMRMGLKGCKLLVTQGPRTAWQLTKEKGRRLQACQKARSLHLISPEERERQKQARFEKEIKFSILTPLYNTPEPFLRALIASMQAQTYPHWELCLADGSDTEHAYVGELCRQAAQEDPRIVYSRLGKNGGISDNTNACIALSSGAYFGLLDHDDVLHESALYEVMKAICEQGADFIYTDEVKFDGAIEDADDFNFKPGFGKDELRSHNYICHFTCYSRALLEATGDQYRPAFDGSQDHDMVLRLSERARCIVHIPKVLYYWRVHSNSVSMDLDSKSYAVDAAIHAVHEQLARAGEPGRVECSPGYKTIYRIRYEMDEPKVSLLLYQADTPKKAKQNIERLRALTAYDNLEFVCWTDAAPEDAKARTADRQRTVAEGWDAMAQAATGALLVPVACGLHPETPDWVREMAMLAQRADVCAVGAKCYDEKDNVWSAGVALDKQTPGYIVHLCRGTHRDQQGYEAMLRYVRNVTAVDGACMMVKKRTWQQLGGFAQAPAGYETVDFCLRGKARGLWNVWTPFAKAKYRADKENMPVDTAAFGEKWARDLAHGDAYYHPSLKMLGLL